ncbi:MAG TPA: hypothetical protein V6D47_02970 [Oscillatoriaceae cyanobacterium]
MNNPLKFLVDYRLTPTSLQVTAMGGQFVVREIPYNEMLEVKRGLEIWNEHWQNRLDFWNHSVSIRLTRPVLPWFVVSPDDPDRFVGELREHIAKAGRA